MNPNKRLHHKIESFVHYLQKFTDRNWYPPLLGLLALIDYFIIIIPTDGLLISSALLKPKNWLSLALWVALGSTIGALILFYLVKTQGINWLLNFYPDFNQGKMWLWTEAFFLKFGLVLVFVIAATPIVQQPIVIIAALAHIPFLHILIAVLSGRLLKSLVLSYISAHSPHLLAKLWGVKAELDEVGLHLDGEIKKEV